jgi:hypothetical protein
MDDVGVPRRVVPMSAALEYAGERWWLGRRLGPDRRRVVLPETFYAGTSAGEKAAPAWSRASTSSVDQRPLVAKTAS